MFTVSLCNQLLQSNFKFSIAFLTQQWAALYQPLTFYGDLHLDTSSEPLLNKLDPAKAFRGKAKPPTPKKKQPAQVPASGGSTAKGQGASGRHSVTKRWPRCPNKCPLTVLIQACWLFFWLMLGIYPDLSSLISSFDAHKSVCKKIIKDQTWTWSPEILQ